VRFLPKVFSVAFIPTSFFGLSSEISCDMFHGKLEELMIAAFSAWAALELVLVAFNASTPWLAVVLPHASSKDGCRTCNS
jgi:hypothetical protein